MDVLYFCSPPLLDYSAEQIKDLKQHVNLHVIVWVSLQTPGHTIFNLEEGADFDGIYRFDSIKSSIKNVKLFEVYFEGCVSVHFVFFPIKIGLNIFRISKALLETVSTLNPEIVHFDDISGRLLIFALLLKNRCIVLNVHDPVAHSGEQNLGYVIMRKILFRRIAAFATFSEYSRLLFHKVFHPKVPVADLRLVPYYCYKALRAEKIPEITKRPNEIVFLFFGRLSPYKGIDELLYAFSKVFQNYPEVRLVIAGKGSFSYMVPEVLVNSSSLVTINRFIADSEIKSLFEQADVIVCPYRDATQSGVLMTAAAFQTPVIVSNVGALSEYIKDGGKGYVYDLNDERGLENCLIQYLTDYSSTNMLVAVTEDTAVSRNSQLLVDLYTQLLGR